jgi:hypothetical protein
MIGNLLESDVYTISNIYYDCKALSPHIGSDISAKSIRNLTHFEVFPVLLASF